MKQIVFANAPPWGVNMPSLGMGYLAESVRHAGYEPIIFDLNVEFHYHASKEDKHLWAIANFYQWKNFGVNDRIFREHQHILDRFFDYVKNNDPILMCFSVNVGNQKSTTDIIKTIRQIKPHVTIAVGGPNIDNEVFVESELATIIDMAVIGEAEEILPQIIKRLEQKKDYADLPGVIPKIKFKKGVKVDRLIVQDPNKLPFPTYKGFPLDKYNEKILAILSSRGCVRNCAFCSDYLMTFKYRGRTAQNLFDEIEYHYKNNKIKTFDFKDLLINGNIATLKEFCQKIIDSKMKIEWSGQGIVRPEMNLELFKLMKKSGFKNITYGVESFSDNVLKKMRKGTNVKLIDKVLRATHKAGIKLQINIIVGFPGETEEDFQKTLNYLKNNSDMITHISSLYFLSIYGNSDVQMNPESYGLIGPEDMSFQEWTRKEGGFFWKDENGVGFEERMNRMHRIINLINELGILYPGFDFDGIYRLAENIRRDAKLQMPKDLMLVNPPPWGIEDPPTGLAYIASYLRKRGLSVGCYDMNIKMYNGVSDEFKMLWHVENKNYWKNEATFNKLKDQFHELIEESVNSILSPGPKVIALNVVDPKERITIDLIKRLKARAPNSKIILGGPGTNSEDGREWFTKEIPHMVDGYIVGEGEETLFEVTQRFLENKDIIDVPGVMVYRDDKYIDYKRRKLLPIFKENIWPSYEDFDLKEYHSDGLRIEWSRGCIADCAFCKGKAINPGYRFREPESIVEELEHHVNVNKIRKFVVVDLTINGNLTRLEKTCDLIIEKKLDIEWLCQGIPRGDMTIQFLKKMKRAGCYEFQLGIETGSDKVAKMMGKIPSVEESQTALRNVSKVGIRTGLFILVGFPNETEEDFDMTLDFIRRNKNYITYVKSVNMVHLIGGTDLKENLEKYGIKKLPDDQWHFRWESKSNNWKIRQKRMSKMYDLLEELEIPLVETNFQEGKEQETDADILAITKKINQLQDLENFTNIKFNEKVQESPVKLFMDCYNEHGITYTVNHTIKYIINKVKR